MRRRTAGRALRPTCFSNIRPAVERSNATSFPGYRDSTKHVPRSGTDSADYISVPATPTEASAASLRTSWMVAAHRSQFQEKPAPAHRPHHSENLATTCHWHFARLVSFATMTRLLARSIAMSLCPLVRAVWMRITRCSVTVSIAIAAGMMVSALASKPLAIHVPTPSSAIQSSVRTETDTCIEDPRCEMP